MHLEIDYGNTRLKWRFHKCPLQSGTLENLLSQVRSTRLDQARIVSVVSAQRQQQLINSVVIASSLPIDWSIAKSTRTCRGVVNAYEKPSQLGADRWCAIVGASVEYQPRTHGLLVLGCGTAFTADFIAKNKHHLGGWIAPGIQALVQGLRQCTQLNFDFTPLHTKMVLGTNTNDGVAFGCHTMLQGYTQQALKKAKHAFGDTFVVVVHGGNAKYVQEVLPQSIEQYHAPELVFDGLGYVCDTSHTPTEI